VIRNKTLDLYEATLTYDSENNPVKTWRKIHAVTDDGELVTDGGDQVTYGAVGQSGNLQPKSLTEQECTLYGISGAAADAMLFLCKNDPEIQRGRRLYDGATKYDIVAVNPWPSHTAVILIPVQGGGA